MTTLREEYKKNKKNKDVLVNEAATQWIMENVLLLNESFNREALTRLQTSISKFDALFAPYGVKVPEVKRSLDDAVNLMNRLTMGEKIHKSDSRLKLSKEESESIKEPATFMVKYMSVLYNNLSRFFSKDVPLLIKFPIFKQAMENPSTPLRDLSESKNMRKAILHALVPSAEVSSLLKRMFRTMELPKLDYDVIADEMLNLSINDFMDLTKVDKVPLVTTPTPVPSPTNGSEVATSPNPKVPSLASEGAEGVERDKEKLLSEEEEILKEFGEINVQQMKQISDGISKITALLSNFPELQETNNALKQLQGQALAAAASNWNIGANTKNIAATANMVYTFFDKLGELGPSLVPLIPSGRALTEQELANIESIMKKAQGGVLQRIGNWFRGKLVNPALSPSEISNQIIATARVGQENPQVGVSAAESLKNFFSRLQGLKLPEVNPAKPPTSNPNSSPTQGPAGSLPSTPSANAQQSGLANPSQATSNASTQAGVSGAPVDPKALAAEMDKTIGGNNLQFTGNIQKLIAAGWKFVPPGR